MRTGLYILLCLFEFRVFAEWKLPQSKDGARASVRLQFEGGDPKGILLTREASYGEPIYFLSLFVKKQVERTSLVTEQLFSSLQERVQEILTGIPAEANSPSLVSDERAGCQEQFSVEVRVSGAQTFLQKVCLDTLTEQQKNAFKEWYATVNR